MNELEWLSRGLSDPMFLRSFKADPPKGQQSSTLQALARYVMKEFSPQLRRDPAAFKAFGQAIITLVRAAIRTFDTSSLVKRYIPPTASQRMIAMIDFCFEVGGQSQCQYLLPRFVPPPTGTTATQHVSGVLAPFLPDLQKYLVGKDLNFEAEPYKTFVVTVAKLFAEKVMTPKPSEPVPASKLRAIGCGCRDCKELKAFFRSAQAVVCLPAVQKIRLHLERELAKTRAWGVSWQTVKAGSPRMLEVRWAITFIERRDTSLCQFDRSRNPPPWSLSRRGVQTARRARRSCFLWAILQRRHAFSGRTIIGCMHAYTGPPTRICPCRWATRTGRSTPRSVWPPLPFQPSQRRGLEPHEDSP